MDGLLTLPHLGIPGQEGGPGDAVSAGHFVEHLACGGGLAGLHISVDHSVVRNDVLAGGLVEDAAGGGQVAGDGVGVGEGVAEEEVGAEAEA